jgi:uncharacterized SAM-binding protein YcdF (DUF218 family)
MRRGRNVVVRIASALLASIPAGWLAVVVAVLEVGRRDEARPADAIVVLGAAQYEGRPSPVLRARLDHALLLWRRSLAPTVVVTGGTGMGDTTSEAAVSRRYMAQRGVPDSAIVMEDRGLTTSQSLRAVAELMRDRPGSSVILVSDPFHMLRLALLARRLGMTPYTSPTRTSPISTSPAQWKYVLAESVKVPLAFLLERAPD